jgi:threonyl-tRNA synthetase
LPIRFDLSYQGADNKTHRPVMIHRAPFGSLERFTGVLIEHFAGAFPLWLSPEQVRVLPISEKSDAYAQELHAALHQAGLRTTLDTSSERVQNRIRIAAEQKIPVTAIVGPRDAERRVVSIRLHGKAENAGEMPFDDFVAALVSDYRTRASETLAGKITPTTK